jgi:predicted transcriptional regulator
VFNKLRERNNGKEEFWEMRGREDRKCPVCGTIFNVPKSLKKATCSPECRKKRMSELEGEETYTTRDVAQIFGISESALSKYKTSKKNPLRKAITMRGRKTLYSKNIIDAIKHKREMLDMLQTYSPGEVADIFGLPLTAISRMGNHGILRGERIFANVLIKSAPRYKKEAVDRIKQETDLLREQTYSTQETANILGIPVSRVRTEGRVGILKDAKKVTVQGFRSGQRRKKC